jgi:ribonuclease J
MLKKIDGLVFVPLGGLGEIGMNCGLYGFGPEKSRKWIMVDLGVAFAGDDLPGVDLIMPDIGFIEKIRKDLLALIITHAHEDHIGAVAELWPKLKCPVYATPFAAGLLEAKRLMEPRAPDIRVHVVQQGGKIALSPFEVEFIAVAHSIPESCALAIRSPAGLIVHTGDWKIDETPMVGRPTDEARFRTLGDEGVLALICDSTNVLREGISPSEADVSKTLTELVAGAQGRVVVTTFASNVARLKATAIAAEAAGRRVAIVGRAMDRVVQVARECGYLEGIAPFLSAQSARDIPRKQLVVLATGSQGEPRAALARMAEDEHPDLKLASGDRVIFSSRPIPGNEKAINNNINGLVAQGIEVVTDRTHLVHVSGHPRRAELQRMYEWVRPQIAIPAHGEALHLAEHAAFARAQGVPHVIKARNGDVVLISDSHGIESAGIIDDVPHGRLLKDGNLLVPFNDEAIHQRRRLSFAGVVTVALALTSKGELAGDPDVVFAGLPTRTATGAMDELVDAAIFTTLDNMPKARRRDADMVVDAIEKAIRSAVGQAWGKKPAVHVLVVEV